MNKSHYELCYLCMLLKIACSGYDTKNTKLVYYTFQIEIITVMLESICIEYRGQDNG